MSANRPTSVKKLFRNFVNKFAVSLFQHHRASTMLCINNQHDATYLVRARKRISRVSVMFSFSEIIKIYVLMNLQWLAMVRRACVSACLCVCQHYFFFALWNFNACWKLFSRTTLCRHRIAFQQHFTAELYATTYFGCISLHHFGSPTFCTLHTD